MERFAIRAARRRAIIGESIDELVAIARDAPDIREVVVFGSYAKNCVGPTSDLDVLVVRETDLPRSQRADDLLVAIRAGVGIDMIVVTPDERMDVLPNTSFGATILAEGRCVYAA
jgi:predicted nucleotidyltransferase